MRDARSAFPGTTPADDAGRQAAAAAAAGNLVERHRRSRVRSGAKHGPVDEPAGPWPDARGRRASVSCPRRPTRLRGSTRSCRASWVLRAGPGPRHAVPRPGWPDEGARERRAEQRRRRAGTASRTSRRPAERSPAVSGSPCNVSLFSDALHPSARAHLLLGDAALRAVPEPATLAPRRLACGTPRFAGDLARPYRHTTAGSNSPHSPREPRQRRFSQADAPVRHQTAATPGDSPGGSWAQAWATGLGDRKGLT